MKFGVHVWREKVNGNAVATEVSASPTGSCEAGMVFRYTTGSSSAYKGSWAQAASRERTKSSAKSNFGGRTQMWAGEWVPWSWKRELRAHTHIHNNCYSCNRTLAPSGCGRFQMLFASLAWGFLILDHHWESWLGWYFLQLKLPDNFPFRSQFEVRVSVGVSSPLQVAFLGWAPLKWPSPAPLQRLS